MEFCSNSSDLVNLWTDGGLSRCFADVVGPAFPLAWITILGSAQCFFYAKYAIATERRLISRTPCLLSFQIFLHVLLALETILRFLLQYFIINNHETVFGSDILPLTLLIAHLLAAYIILLERRRVLPSIHTRGHGIILLIFWTLSFLYNTLPIISWQSSQWWFKSDISIELGLWILRIICTVLVLIVGLKAPGVSSKNFHLLNNANEDQAEALLQDVPEPSQQTQRNESAWAGIWRKCKIIWPFIWPRNSLLLQFRVVICFLVLAAGRGVNLLVPIYYKQIVNSLTITSEIPKLKFRYDLILIYILLKFLQGGGFGSMGLLNNFRTFLWIRVQQYTTKQISCELYQHLHGLSLRWHLSRKTGEVLRVMDRGTTSINSILSTVIFNLMPTIVDIVIAIIYFIAAFNPLFGLIVFLSMILYLIATIGITEWRTKYRREMNLLDNARNQKGVDSLLNFETVKYYGGEAFEINQYRDAITKYQTAEWVSMATLNFLNTVQNVVITGGFLSGTLLCAYYVVEDWGGITVGDFVLFATYIVQLYGPLNFFGTFYRMLQQSFIDMENMFDLLKEEKEIKDVPNALDLQLKTGAIKFENVNFHYAPEKEILKNISFEVPAGCTVALVGPSGSGKSTIIRLLFRFYDVQNGRISVDDQDVSMVTQESLRRNIGVVPQDTVLFNADVMYNVRYGRTTASDEDIHHAARAADIHDRIISFPDQYNTMVGERGLKLSGGEKQRVCIARTILKAPAIVLLDEATSSLDTQTERNIQASLNQVCENRTSIVVAHRLSTIIQADLILVLKDGEIVERGKHDDLLAQNGLYCDMWQQQQQTSEEEEDSGSVAGEDR